MSTRLCSIYRLWRSLQISTSQQSVLITTAWVAQDLTNNRSNEENCLFLFTVERLSIASWPFTPFNLTRYFRHCSIINFCNKTLYPTTLFIKSKRYEINARNISLTLWLKSAVYSYRASANVSAACYDYSLPTTYITFS